MRIQYLSYIPNSKERKLFVYGKDHCDWCDKELKNLVCHYFNCDERFGEKVFCPNCVTQIDSAYTKLGQPEWRWANHVTKIPRGAVPILTPTQFTFSKTIPEAMLERNDGVQIIDKTKWAGRDLQLDGTEIVGKSLAQLEQEEGWKEDALDLLDFHMVATPVLPFQEEKKRLR